MAIARHLAIDRRIAGLAKENADLNDDIGQLEDALKLHQKLTSEKQNSVRALIRNEIGGPIWQHGGKGKMKNYKSKKDMRAAPDTSRNLGSSLGVQPKSTRSNESVSPTIVLNQKTVSVCNTKLDVDSVDGAQRKAYPKDVAVDVQKVPPVQVPSRKITGMKNISSDDVQLESKIVTNDRMPRPTSRAASRHFRSLSARGPRKKTVPEKSAPDLDTLQGHALDLSAKFTTTVSDSEEERLSVKYVEEKTYEEKVSELKKKVLNKVLSKTEVEKKLKNFKTVNSGDGESQRKPINGLTANEGTPQPPTREIERKGDTRSKSSVETVSTDERMSSKDSFSELDVWIMELNLKDPYKYRQILKQNEITPQILLTMTDLDLKRIGVENAIVLSKIKRGLSKLKSMNSKSNQLPGKAKNKEKGDSGKFEISLEGTKSEEQTTPEHPEKKENERKFSKEDDESKSVGEEGEVQDLGVKEKVSGSNTSRGTQRTAWGVGPGLRQTSGSQSLRSRPSSAAPRIKSRPASAKSGKPGIVRKGPPPRPQSASAFGKKRDAKSVDPGLNVGDTPQDGATSQKKISARGNTDAEHSRNESDLKISGANLASPGRSQVVRETRPATQTKGTENLSSRASAARLAIETMESQIAILQKDAALTGDASTMALIAQLQEQLAQIQQAVTQENQTEEIVSPNVKDIPPAAGNLVTAALQGNVRPMAFKHPTVGEFDDDDDSDDKEPNRNDGDFEAPVPAPSQAGIGPPRRSSSASVSKGRTPASPLNMSMSKQAILKEVRKQKEEHRRTVRHLESELARLKHKDPLRNSEVPEEDIEYNETDLIGEGAFSQVFYGMFQGTQVAVKRLKVPLGAQDKNYFIAEVNLLRELRHPRVVLLMGVCTSSHLPLMVLEFMDGGSLYGYLHDENCPSLDHAAYYQIAQDIAVGMNYLHRHRPTVLHLDLKSMNVLLLSNLRAKIGDFGFSKLRHDAELAGSQRGSAKGTPAWMAPELLGGGDITTKADVYSYGIILWEMITRRRPYEGCSMYQVIERVRNNRRPELPEDCPAGLSAVVTACWEQNPARRPAFQEVLHYLEELHLPPEWKSLFAAAGLPKVALDDIEATRSLIDIVAHTIETGHVPKIPDPADDQKNASHAASATQKTESRTMPSGRVRGARANPGVKGKTKGKPDTQNTRVNTKGRNADRPAPPPPPPPPPVPPPTDIETKPSSDHRPASNVNFMDQLKAGLQEIQLKPTVHEERPAVPEPRGAQGDRAKVNGPAPPGLLALDAMDLVSQRNRLRPTVQPHPSQLQDLSKVSEGTRSGLAEVLRRAVNERRSALNAGVNSIDLSQQSYIDSGWSID